MPLNSTDWAAFLPHSVQVSTAGARRTDGSATFGSASTYRARIVQRQREINVGEGRVTLANGWAWVASTGRINTTDKIKVPSAMLPTSTPTILLVETFPDEAGTYHNKVYLG